MRIAATVLVMLMAVSASAQLTITRADVESRIAETEGTGHSATNAEGMTFDLTGPVYDMTVFETTAESFSVSYLDPSLTTYPHEFPAATHAQIVSDGALEGFTYLRLDDDGMYLLGFAGEMEGGDYILKYQPERPSMMFPYRKGTSWTWKSDIMAPFEGMERVEETDVEVIAEGTLRTPLGDFPCLVERQWLRSSTKLSFGGQVISESYYTDVTYQFITKNGVDASITVDTLDAESMTPSLIDARWSVTGTQTTAQAAPAATDLRISAVYPNPARSGVLSVDWNAETAGNTRLDIIDALGRVHGVLHQGNVLPGNHTAQTQLSGMPAGLYFLRLVQGTRVATRPLTVVH